MFGVLAGGCSHKIDTTQIITTHDIIRFLIRNNPGIFSNTFLDTSRVSAAGSDFSFSRSFTVRSLDTAITLNDFDTSYQGGGISVVDRNPRDAGAEIIDTLIGQLKIDSAGNSRAAKNFRLPVTKFGYFQKLQSDAFANRGWDLMGATQTFAGFIRIIDSVQIVGITSKRDTLVIRQGRNTSLRPLDDPQVFKVRTSPYQLLPTDSVQVKVWLRNTSIDSIFYVYCHINDASGKRRIQLAEITPRFFFGSFDLSKAPQTLYDFRRLAVDVIANSTLTDPLASFYNEIWGIIYQVHP